jgi:hypothetical protein
MTDEDNYVKKFPLWNDFNYIVTGGKSTATFFPSGSALLSENNLNYTNYRELFGNDIPSTVLKTIDGYTKKTKEEAKKTFEKTSRWYGFYLTCHSISDKILTYSLIMAIFTLPFYTYIQIGIPNIVDTEIVRQYLYFLIGIFIISFLTTFGLNIKIPGIQKTLDLISQRMKEI